VTRGQLLGRIAGASALLVVAVLMATFYVFRRAGSAPELSRYGIAAGSQLPWMSSTDQGHFLDLMQQAGAKVLRFDIDWQSIQADGPASYNWSAQDAVVHDAPARGISIIGTIAYTPTWARPSSTDAFNPPTHTSDYANFCAASARHYGPMGVHAFEVWNEPNISGFWKPAPDVVRYTQMLKGCYTAIKAVDPSDIVITGGTAPAGFYDNSGSPTTVNAINWLAGIYANGGQGYFDAVGHHPYTFPYVPSTVANWSAWYQMADTSPSLRSVMIAHGDGNKQIWATEWGTPTNGPTGSGYVSEAAQAAQIGEAYALWKTYPWAGPLCYYNFVDDGTTTDTIENFFGLIRNDWTLKPGYTAYKNAAAG